MNSIDRRKYIQDLLIRIDRPEKGSVLANKLGVTRQVIVKDIAILRAEGKNIISTPEGYLIPNELINSVKKIVAVLHNTNDIEAEFKSIIKFGGTVEDVIVEHPLYGEIKGMIMVKTLYDIENFIKKINSNKVEPLLTLTGGVHLHTVSADSYDTIQKILRELKEKGFLVCD